MDSWKKPPLGLIPKEIHDHKRFMEICKAISRFYNCGEKIPVKWIEEYNSLVENIKLDEQ